MGNQKKYLFYKKAEFEGSDDEGDKCDESDDQGLNGSGDKNNENMDVDEGWIELEGENDENGCHWQRDGTMKADRCCDVTCLK